MKVERRCDNHPDREASSFCVGCGKAICPECERPQAGRPYCAPCAKARKKEKRMADSQRRAEGIGSGIAGAARAAAEGAKHGAPEKFPKEALRAAAFAVDSAAIVLISIPLTLIFRAASMQWMSDIGGMGYPVSVYLSVLTVSSLYFILWHWRVGATPGKALLGLKVKSAAGGGPVGAVASVWRWVGMLAAIIWAAAGAAVMWRIILWGKYLTKGLSMPQAVVVFVFGAAVMAALSSGLLITLVGKHKRGFHDLLGGTVVERDIKKNRRRESESETGEVPVRGD
ncbi:MAG TPA: RDD family protein [bacterium]|nr:RDD family protein [bacterium]